MIKVLATEFTEIVLRGFLNKVNNFS